MRATCLAACVALLGTSQAVQTKRIVGTLNDRLTAEGDMAQIELKPSRDRDLPGVVDGDKVFRATTPQLRPAGAPEGLLVALVETGTGTFLFVDANLDGRLSSSERRPYAPAGDHVAAPDIVIDITPATAGAPVLPFRCRVTTEEWEGEMRHHLQFTASFRAEGHAIIGQRRTLVSLPFSAARGTIDVRYGKIGIDVNGDGSVDLRGLSGPEVIFARGDVAMLPVGGTLVSVESADFAARSFVLREHAPEEYSVIDVRTGAPLPDFDFTDFHGRARKLSEFKGQYVLLDFWGSWCAPCIADLPLMKAAYERFGGRGFEILGIDYEHTATTDSVRALLKEKNISWPNATPESVKELVEKRFRIFGFPTFILLDPQGVVIETRTPELSGKGLMATLERILEKRDFARDAALPNP